MPMGIVSDDAFDRELENLAPKPKAEAEIVELNKKGRAEGDTGVPDSLRKIIGETAELDGRQEGLALASQFGISPASVSAYANGATSTATYHNTDKTHINEAKERISKRARIKLMEAMKHITSEKLEVAKPAVLAGIARDMSAIVKNMEPEPDRTGTTNNVNAPQFIFYSPQVRNEKDFDIVFVKE